MKKLFSVSMILIFVGSYSIAITPPVSVQKAFKEKFSTANKVKWGKEGAKEWEAEFTFDGRKISANFAEDGTWLETEMSVKVSELPIGVAETIKSKYAGWTITEADKTYTSKHGIIYEAALKKGSAKKEVAFKEDGSLIVE